MCLGIPGQLKEISEVNGHLARVDVSGVTRIVNIGLLEDESLAPGDWVLIHVGFAMSKIDEAEADIGAGLPAAHGPGLRRRTGRILAIEDLE